MRMLSGFKVVAAFDEIVESAARTLVVVTPYFDPWPHLAATLAQKLDQKLPVYLLLRGGEDRAKGESAAAAFAQRGARVQFLDRLHAKVYLNERQALLTSMNLIKASRDSWEVGTLFDAGQDAASYQEIVAMTRGLFDTVSLTNVAAPPPAPEPRAPARSPAPKATTTRRSGGYCIRCAKEIPSNIENPLCRDCFASWADYENPNYQEKHCHGCGRAWASSMAKPLCRTCYGRAS